MTKTAFSVPFSVRVRKAVRSWHAWLGVLGALFMALVAITGILLEVPRSWHLGEISVPVRWVPGYAATGADRILTQVKCALVLADGSGYVGTRKGLFFVRAGEAVPVPELDGKDVFNLTLRGGDLLVGTRESAWLRSADGRWTMIADARGAASFAEDGRVVLNKGAAGLHATADYGRTWVPLAGFNDAVRASPYPQSVTVSQLVLDLHTGAALVGPRAMPIYVYIVSAALLVLVISGIVIRPAYLRLRRTGPPVPALPKAK